VDFLQQKTISPVKTHEVLKASPSKGMHNSQTWKEITAEKETRQ